MARKKKQKRKNGGGNGGKGIFGEDLVRETLGNWIGTLLATGTGLVAARLAGSGPGTNQDDDVTAKVLQSLAEHGPRTIAELVEDTGKGLTPILEAVRSAREFRLVEFVEDRDVVQLTGGGDGVVTVLPKGRIAGEARWRLER